MTIHIQTSGLTVSVSVSANPGAGQSYSETSLPTVNWGDGLNETAPSLPGTLQHTYKNAGTYNIEFSIANDCGKTCKTTEQVAVEEPVTSCTGKTLTECNADPNCHWWTSDSKCHGIPEPSSDVILSVSSDADIISGIDIYVNNIKQYDQTPTKLMFTESDIGTTLEIYGSFEDIISTKKKSITLTAGINEVNLDLLMDNKEFLAGGAFASLLMIKLL